MTRSEEYAQYLAAEYISNNWSEEMSIREFVSGEVETCDAVTADVLEESYASKEEAVEAITTYVENVFNNQK